MSTWFAPGRANLMGEHTDYNEGLVLPFALAQGVTATVAARSDGLLVMRSKQMSGDPVIVAVGELSPGSVRGWAAYPAGVAWSLAAAGYPVGGADIDIDSDLPVGAGVSSSAALECSVGLALCELGGFVVQRRELAAIARRAENDFVGAPTGMIDQSAALLCQAGHAMLLDCGTREIRQVPFDPARPGMAALVIDTRVPHALVSGEYAARRAECEEATRQLGVPSLGSLISAASASAGSAPGPAGTASADAGPAADGLEAALRRLADPVLRRRARHVLTDSVRARAIASLLAASEPGIPTRSPGSRAVKGSIDPLTARDHENQPGLGAVEPHARATRAMLTSRFTPPPPTPATPDIYRYIGDLLTEGHASLRDDFEVSWEAADVTVATVLAAGALGAKMIGGGFGGSVLALLPVDAVPEARAAVAAEFARRSWEAPGFLDAVPSPAAHRLA